ncbi:MAG: carbamoyltransferase HypF [Eubacteriales bacterium]
MDREESRGSITVNIKLWGIVQGVGFRPFVAKLAKAMDIKGKVRNQGGLVEIIITDTEDRIDLFISTIKANKPAPAEIVHLEKSVVATEEFSGFDISESGEEFEGIAMIPSDLAICPACVEEIYDKTNRRFRHPYNSCMICGPRYSLTRDIPYDRHNTTMNEFEMCSQCKEEYTDIDNRRFHAQTISCHDCGPYNEFAYFEQVDVEKPEDETDNNSKSDISNSDIDNKVDGNRKLTRYDKENESAISKAVDLINSGGILALKGTGGYYLACSAVSDQACKNLRKMKKREEKPFGVMFRGMEQIKKYCQCTKEEEELLTSNARPIVLLEKNLNSGSMQVSESVSKSSRYIGAFLPSIGIQYLILDKTGPLVMTSANAPSQPIIISDEEIKEVLNNEVKGCEKGTKGFENNKKTRIGMLYHQREIITRLDDSVVRVIDHQPQMIRRSKGYAPVPLFINGEEFVNRNGESENTGGIPNTSILAMGGQLKSAFTLTSGNYAYTSEFLSDLDSYENTSIYEERLEKLQTLLKIKPSLIVCDNHPLYFTTKLAKEIGARENIKVIMVQHHHAHIASVMAEHDIKGSVIGFSFDGTGFGTDRNIWGSEILICQNAEFARMGHLEYVSMLGGDSSMKEGWKSCFSYLEAFGLADTSGINDPRFEIVKAALTNNINSIRSTSMGRLFDGISSLIDIHHENSYEGECAIMLENFAAKAINEGIAPYGMKFEVDAMNIFSPKAVLQSIIKGKQEGASKEAMALGFHNAVAELILECSLRIRQKEDINQVALSGGVFQNKILMEKTLELLRKEGFETYYNISVPPNDGGISLGQAYIGKLIADRQ